MSEETSVSEMFNADVINTMLGDARSTWTKRWPEIEMHFQRCCLSISFDIVMKYCRLFPKKGDEETFKSIKSKIKLNPEAEYVFLKMLNILVEENILETNNDTYKCLDPLPDIQGAAEWLVNAVRAIPEEGAAFQWLSRGFDGLYNFVIGKTSGEEVMFGPWSDFTLLIDVYYTSDVYKFWSVLAGKTVKRLVDDKFKDKKVTILEVGAGTGSGTFEMFKSMKKPAKYIEKFIFTDIHKRLVKKSSKNFTDYDFMEFKALDLTQPLAEQDIEEESVDILYAVNVMHAINNISNACDAMNKIVKPGGYVVLGEISPPPDKLYRYMELTFGLLASYHQYDDKDIRPNSPLLRPEQWIEHFKKAGFTNALAIPGDKLEGSDRGGSIIAKK